MIPGFNSAQRAYDNMEPASGCDCPQLFSCPVCDEYCTTPECPNAQCEQDNHEEDHTPELVDRDESTEGILTDPSCDLHNHFCRERWCCDDPRDYMD